MLKLYLDKYYYNHECPYNRRIPKGGHQIAVQACSTDIILKGAMHFWFIVSAINILRG